MTAMTDGASLEQQADRAASAGDLAAAKALLGQALESGESNAGLWMKLSAMHKASGDLPQALAAVDRSLALAPLDFAALLYRAVVLDQMADPRAGQAFGHAVAQAPPDDQVPAPMRVPLAHARNKWREHQAGLEQRLGAFLGSDLQQFTRARLERFISNYTRHTRPFHQEPSDFHFPGLPEFEFHDRALFPELDALEPRADEIRTEFEALLSAELAVMVPYIQYPDRVPLRQWRELNNNRDWTAIHLIQNGKRVEANARHCPATMAALELLPQPRVPGASPNAMFSLLAPKTRIPPHTGVANTRLVCHLPLIVPPQCRFRVGESVREWTAGQALVFDDTIEHEAWNDSDELRVVLIFDLWPPALGAAEREAVAAMIGAAGVGFNGL